MGRSRYPRAPPCAAPTAASTPRTRRPRPSRRCRSPPPARPPCAPRASKARAALGAFLALSAKLSMAPLVLACLLPLLRRPRLWGWPGFGVAAALGGHALYNFVRFGTVLATGYGAQATPAAYTTPILVGLYG